MPIVCPSSCVATSAMAQLFHPGQLPKPLLNMSLPITISWKSTPLTSRVTFERQYPPIARMPLQPTGSVTSLQGSLKTMRLLPLQPAY